jgi:hypothetical protein
MYFECGRTKIVSKDFTMLSDIVCPVIIVYINQVFSTCFVYPEQCSPFWSYIGLYKNQICLGSRFNFSFIGTHAIFSNRIAESYTIYMYKMYNCMIFYIQSHVTISQSILESVHHP